jgi:DNA-binding response OmpR family regulator
MTGCDAVLVEDEDDLREIICAVLTGSGMTVEAVANGRDARDAFDRLHPRVLLLDLIIPGEIDAAALARHVRESPRPIPIIAISGLPDLAKHARRIGASAIVPKPFSSDELLAAMLPWCRRKAPLPKAPERLADGTLRTRLRG